MMQTSKPKFYAGIGSRETPFEVRNTMNKIANAFSRMHWVLRSGGANGADTAFETGCVVSKSKEIWLPWRGFNDNESEFYVPENLSANDSYTKQFLKIAKVAREYHPRWSYLKMGTKRMMTRNVCQVLGWDLNSPVEFVACWTRDGGATGGTGQAIRIAEDRDIPVYNLFYRDQLEALREYYKSIISPVLT